MGRGWFFNFHPWRVSPEEAIKIQNELRKRIVLKNNSGEIKSIAGVDVGYSGKTATAVISVLSFPELELIETVKAKKKIGFPYIPGLLTFREGPAVLSAYRKLRHSPDLILFDGQGMLHPRRMGIATHIGILVDKPTIGCAKSPLYLRYKKPGEKRGCKTFIRDRNGEILGVALCTRDGVKPVFVSCGNKIDLNSAVKIVLASTRGYRIPEPLRLAHRLSKKGKQ